MVPETHYTQSDGLSIAYQVIGDGTVDIVLVPGWLSNVEVFWEEPIVARFLRDLASFARLILFDKRGTGLSDRLVEVATLEQRLDDVRAVHHARCWRSGFHLGSRDRDDAPSRAGETRRADQGTQTARLRLPGFAGIHRTRARTGPGGAERSRSGWSEGQGCVAGAVSRTQKRKVQGGSE